MARSRSLRDSPETKLRWRHYCETLNENCKKYGSPLKPKTPLTVDEQHELLEGEEYERG